MKKQTPKIGEPLTICSMPDLKELNGAIPEKQQIVDHGIIQAENRAWQLWACLRGVKISRLIYGWEGSSLEKGAWRQAGVKLRANADAGENFPREGVEQVGAPFFIEEDGHYYCFYHSNGFRVVRSVDGVNYKRGIPNTTSIPGGRDVMIMKHKGLFYSYATTTTSDGKSYVESATSTDLIDWSESKIVSRGGRGGSGDVDAESPFVVFVDGYFYLFRTSSVSFKTVVYCSEDPQSFGLDDDSKFVAELDIKIPELFQHENEWYITHISDDFQSVFLSRVDWELVTPSLKS